VQDQKDKSALIKRAIKTINLNISIKMILRLFEDNTVFKKENGKF